MSKLSYKRRLSGWRLGAALVGLAIPFAVALPASAQSATDVADTATTCIGLGFTAGQCGDAIGAGIVTLTENNVNSSLSSQGIDHTVSLGDATKPLTTTFNSGNPAVPAVPMIPVPPVPGIGQ